MVRLRIARHGRPAAVHRAVEALRQLLRAVEAPPVGREREFARAGIQRRHLLEPHVDPLNGRRRRQAVAPVLRTRHLHRHRRDGAVRGRLVGEVEAADLARPLPQAHEPVGAVRGVHPVVGHRRAVLLGLFLALRRCLGGKALSRIVDVFVVRRERRHIEPVLDVAVKPVVPERRDRREAAVGDVEVDHVPRVAAVEALRQEFGVGIAPAVVHARGRDVLLRAAHEPRTAEEALAGRRIRNRERRLHAQHGRPSARLVIGARRPQLRHRRRPRGDHVVDQDEAVGIVHLPGVAALVRQDARAADAEARRLAAVDLRKDAVERELVDPPAVLHVQAVERVEGLQGRQRPVADLHRPERRLAPFGRGELDVVRVVGPFDDELVAFLLHVRERVGVHDVEVHRADAVRVGGRGDVRAEVGTVLRRAEVPHHQLAGLAVRERCLLRRPRADALRRRRPRQRVEAVRDGRRLVRQHHVADVDVLQRPERVRHAALRMLQLVAVAEPEVVHDARRRRVPLVHPPRVERLVGALRAPVRLAGHRTGGGRVVVRQEDAPGERGRDGPARGDRRRIVVDDLEVEDARAVEEHVRAGIGAGNAGFGIEHVELDRVRADLARIRKRHLDLVGHLDEAVGDRAHDQRTEARVHLGRRQLADVPVTLERGLLLPPVHPHAALEVLAVRTVHEAERAELLVFHRVVLRLDPRIRAVDVRDAHLVGGAGLAHEEVLKVVLRHRPGVRGRLVGAVEIERTRLARAGRRHLEDELVPVRAHVGNRLVAEVLFVRVGPDGAVVVVDRQAPARVLVVLQRRLLAGEEIDVAAHGLHAAAGLVVVAAIPARHREGTRRRAHVGLVVGHHDVALGENGVADARGLLGIGRQDLDVALRVQRGADGRRVRKHARFRHVVQVPDAHVAVRPRVGRRQVGDERSARVAVPVHAELRRLAGGDPGDLHPHERLAAIVPLLDFIGE